MIEDVGKRLNLISDKTDSESKEQIISYLETKF